MSSSFSWTGLAAWCWLPPLIAGSHRPLLVVVGIRRSLAVVAFQILLDKI